MSAMRMDLAVAPGGTVVVGETYNANPTSVIAALDVLTVADAHRRAAILGGMGELDDPADGHERVAGYARRLGIELIAVGTDLYGVVPSSDSIGARGAGLAVLVKASWVNRLVLLVGELLGTTTK